MQDIKTMISHYADIKLEIDELEATVAKLNNSFDDLPISEDIVRGSQMEFPFTEHNIHIRGFEHKLYMRKMHALKQRQELLLRRQAELVELELKIEEYFSTLDNARMRLLLRYRFLDKLSWSQIARKVNSTPDACRMEVKRFLDKNENKEVVVNG